jgi:hypothetical protein
MTPLILKRAPIDWNQEDYEVLEDGGGVGRVFLMSIGLKGRPWMWPIGNARGALRRTDTSPRARRRWPRSLRAGAEVRISRSLARSSSSPWLRSVASECPICPMSINLTPYRIRGIAHSRHCSGKFILAATELFYPIANLLSSVHANA